MGICKKLRPFNHIFGADRILEHDKEASKMEGRARGRKGERKTYHMWEKPQRVRKAKRKGSYHTKIWKEFLPTPI